MTPSLFELFTKGGWVMWPILLCSIAALGIALERLIWLTRVEMESEPFFSQISQKIKSNQTTQAEKLCGQNPLPLARVVKAGLARLGRSRAEVKESLEEAGALAVPSLEQHLPILGTIAHLTPLLGLLGTVAGLVRCFQVIQEKATAINPVNPGDLAGGIWESLLTTVFGLLVAIPAYAVYNYLVYRVNTLVIQMEHFSGQLVDLLCDRKTTSPFRKALHEVQT